MLVLLCVLATFLGCDAGEQDLCADVELPSCPEECPEDYASTCGEPCDEEGEECGNSIGDGRVCADGVFSCTVHAPLEPYECNWVCDPDE